jgi:hypothetical protein
MRAFDSRHYSLISHGSYDLGGFKVTGWLFSTLNHRDLKNYEETYIIVRQATYTYGGSVYHLDINGTIRSSAGIDVHLAELIESVK